MFDSFIKLRDKFDKSDMYGKIRGMPDNIDTGLEIGMNADLLGLDRKKFDSIVLAGMGGSAIAGDIARSFLSDKLTVPFAVQRDYKLPAYINENSLVICSSYSGNTEESLSAFNDAVERGASVVAITTGGELGKNALANNIPVVKIPGGLPPRAALGLSYAPLMVLLNRLGLIENYYEDIKKASSMMRERLSEYSFENENYEAIKIASQLYGKIPIIYAGVDHLDSIAVRFKGQICENSKCLAFANIFPEFNHNELVGWQELYNLDKNLIAVIIKDKDDFKRTKYRMDIVSEYLKDNGREVIEIEEDSGNFLARTFLLIQKFDFVSYYLALMNEYDPTPVTPIDYLKNKLSVLK